MLATMTDPTTNLTDESLVLRCARPGGDEAAATELLDRHWARVFRVAVQLLDGDPGAADDVAQETFLGLLSSAGRFERGRAFDPWLFGILRRTALQHRRGEGRRKKRERAQAPRDLPADLDGDLADDASRSEEAALVREHLRSLPRDCRHALALRYMEGLSLAEVARALGCPEGTASSRIRRGLERLREQLTPVLGAASVAAGLERWIATAMDAAAPEAPGAAALTASAASIAAGADATPDPDASTTSPAKGGRAAKPIAFAAATVAAVAILGVLLWPADRDRSIPATIAATGSGATSSTNPNGNASSGDGSTTGEATDAGGGAGDAASAGGDRATEDATVSGRLRTTEPLRDAWVAVIAPETLDPPGVPPAFRDGAGMRRALGREGFSWNVPEGSTPVGESGAFTLELPPGEHLLAAGAHGCRTRLVSIVTPIAEPLDLELTWLAPATLELHVVDDRGEPYGRCWLSVPSPARDAGWVDGLDAWASPRERGDWIPRIIRRGTIGPIPLDDDGRGRLLWPAGDYPSLRLAIHEPTRERGMPPMLMGSLEAPSGALSLAPDAVTERRVEASWRSRSYRGHRSAVDVLVIDADGQPVPDAWVQIRRHASDDVEGLRRSATTAAWTWVTGSDGRVLIRGAKTGQPFFIAARQGDRWSGLGQQFQVGESEERHVVRVTLDRPFVTGDLRLELRDATTGDPAGSEIQIAARGSFVSFGVRWDVWLEPLSGQPSAGSAHWRIESAGVLLIDDLPPGRWRAHVRQPEGDRAISYLPAKAELTTEAGARAEVTVSLTRAGTVRGRVRADGRPVLEGQGAMGAVHIFDAETRERATSVDIDGAGRFVASSLPPGRRYHVVVGRVPGFLPGIFLSLPSDGEEQVLDLSLEVGLELAVVDPEGKPVAGARVEEVGIGDLTATRSDAGGVVRWRGGRLRRAVELQVSQMGRDPVTVKIAPSRALPETARVVLAPAAGTVPLRGQVVDDDGEPVAGAEVELGGSPVAVTDAAGAFGTWVEPDTYNVSLLREGHARRRIAIEVGRDGLVDERFTLPRGARVTGRLVGTEKALAAVTRIYIFDPTGRRGAKIRPADDGTFESAHLLPGAWTLRVAGKGGRDDVLVERALELAAGVDTEVRIELVGE